MQRSDVAEKYTWGGQRTAHLEPLHPRSTAWINRSLYEVTVLAFGDAITRSINPMFIFTIIATVALTVLAYIKRNSVPLWLAVLCAWAYAIPLAETQLGAFVHSAWSSWFGA